MLHQMKLDIEPFGRIKDGEKTLELRLYDEKRRKIGIGDEIEFSKRPDLVETVKVEVVGLLLYKNFADLIHDIPASYLGGYETAEKEYLAASMYEIYTKEEEEEDGVLGIRIRLIGKRK